MEYCTMEEMKNAIKVDGMAGLPMPVCPDYGFQDLAGVGMSLSPPRSPKRMLVAPPNFAPMQRLGDGDNTSRPKPTQAPFYLHLPQTDGAGRDVSFQRSFQSFHPIGAATTLVFATPNGAPAIIVKMTLITAAPSLPTLSPPPTPATGLLTFFLPDSAPSSLVASIVQVTYVATVSNSTLGEWVTSLVLDCPPTTKPVKDECRAAGIYPASVYHTRGSVWGGTTTRAADDSTTTWRCELGERYTPSVNGTSRPGSSAYCTKTIEAPGKARETVTAQYDHCYLAHQKLPIVVTAGGEKLAPGGGGFYSGIDAGGINSALASEAGSITGCPVASEVFWKIPNVGPGMLGSATSTKTRAGGGGGATPPAPTDDGLGGGTGGGAGGGGGGGGPGPVAPPTTSIVPSAGGRMLPPGFGVVKGAMAALALLALSGV